MLCAENRIMRNANHVVVSLGISQGAIHLIYLSLRPACRHLKNRYFRRILTISPHRPSQLRGSRRALSSILDTAHNTLDISCPSASLRCHQCPLFNYTLRCYVIYFWWTLMLWANHLMYYCQISTPPFGRWANDDRIMSTPSKPAMSWKPRYSEINLMAPFPWWALTINAHWCVCATNS